MGGEGAPTTPKHLGFQRCYSGRPAEIADTPTVVTNGGDGGSAVHRGGRRNLNIGRAACSRCTAIKPAHPEPASPVSASGITQRPWPPATCYRADAGARCGFNNTDRGPGRVDSAPTRRAGRVAAWFRQCSSNRVAWQPHGSFLTPRWRKADSNHQSLWARRSTRPAEQQAGLYAVHLGIDHCARRSDSVGARTCASRRINQRER
jgi:hypothetical protein